MSDTGSVVGAIDIGGTKIAVGLVADGHVLDRTDVPTQPERSFDMAMRRVIDALADLALSRAVTLRGIGIGATGPIDPIGGAFGTVPFFPHWASGNPVKTLGEAFGVPAAAENDADAAALGEAAWGAGKDARRFVFVTVGTGIGGGVVLDGRLYRGVGGAHPEIGHMIVEAFGPSCSCGGRGCWEAVAAGPAMAEFFGAQVRTEAGGAVTAKDVCDLARTGHPGAIDAVQREARYLGVGLASLVTTFAPDLIALGGSVMGSYDLFVDTIRDVVRERATLVPWTVETIRPAELGADAGVIGAAEVWRHRFMGDQR